MIHGCFTGISAWFIRGILGIRPDPASLGFKHFAIKPAVVGDINWAKGEYHSPYGRIGCDWALSNGMLNVKVDIPANTSATLCLPTTDPARAVFELPSGRHELSIPFSQPPEQKDH